jgi:methionyl-tRNA formyltransferase
MNIVFFGSAKFCVPSLEALVKSGHTVSCVVTQPDRRQGRGLRYAPTPVKTQALLCGLKVYQPERINTPETLKFLLGLSADLFVVIAYGQILSSRVLSIPLVFCLNVHASLLPLYRGAAPMNWAIINGEKNTGITTIKMVRKMDAGPMILQSRIEIAPDDTILSLEQKMAQQAEGILLESIKAIENKQFSLIPQDESKVSFAPKLKKEDGLIDWHKKSAEIYNLVRGCLDWPTAFTYYKGKRLKIYAAKSQDQKSPSESASPGEIIDVSSEAIAVATGQGALLIEKVQLEARRMMSAREFLAGHRITPGEKLGQSQG